MADDVFKEIKRMLEREKVIALLAIARHFRSSERTVQRHLKKLDCQASFTHKRRFFTLRMTPQFDENGLWFYRQIGFSKFGNGLDTIVSQINQSARGLSKDELETTMKIDLSKQIQILVQREKIHRIKLGNKYLYVPEAAMKDKTRRFKIVGDRQAEEQFHASVQRADLIALLKAILLEKKVGIDIKSIKNLVRKYSLQIPWGKIQQLLLKYELLEKKTQ